MKKNIMKVITESIDKQNNNLTQTLIKKYYENEQEVVIDVVINENDMYNVRSSSRQRTLSSDIFDFIDSTAYYIPVKMPIVINVITDIVDAEKLDFIKTQINNHYLLQVQDKKDDLKKVKWTYTLLATFGILLLALYFVLASRNNSTLFLEILSIAGTFLMWEAVDFFVFQRTEKRIALLNVSQLWFSNITINGK